MVARVLAAVHVALLAASASGAGGDARITLLKCCEENQMLSADGGSCTAAPWSRSPSIGGSDRSIMRPTLDSEWVAHWLPPGVPLRYIREIHADRFLKNAFVTSVNASSVWDAALLGEEELWRGTLALAEQGQYMARPRPRGGTRKADYCVDGALPPLGPFAARFQTRCGDAECARKCCWSGELPKRNGEGKWGCHKDPAGVWSLEESNLTEHLDAESPFEGLTACFNPDLWPLELRLAPWAMAAGGRRQFLFSTWTFCFDLTRGGDGGLREGLFYCATPHVTRGAYWLLRALCLPAVLLLAAALLTILGRRDMRRKVHGRCLAAHAACLLAFNVGQTGYYYSISDRLDNYGKGYLAPREYIPPELTSVCKYFALCMYFLLTSSWFWLAALCINMAMGFRLQITRPNKGNRKRYLALSAFAWGLPAVLTISCFHLNAHEVKPTFSDNNLRWYNPSLAESRVCYIERMVYDYSAKGYSIYFLKSGTALFYYGPVCCLVVSNIICLALTLRKVQYLKRGNSVLRREEDQIPLGQMHTEGNSHRTAHTATANGQTRENRNRRGTTVDAKTIKLYIKMILTTGGIELFFEIIMWSTTVFEGTNVHSETDLGLAYRAAGNVTDFFRAAVVTWLAAPEGGYLGLIMGMLRRGKSEKKPAGAGNAGRRKHNVA